MDWFSTLGRALMLVCAAAVLGSLYGYPLQAVIIALLAVIVFWQVQMHRVQGWLNDPKKAPPDVFGIWGELTARIYSHQRSNKKIQQRLQSNVEYLQGSFSSMRDGVVMIDEQGVISWSNDAVTPLLGLRYPEDTGQTLTNLVREPAFNDYFLAGDYSSPLAFATAVNSSKHLRVEITYFGRGERLLFVRDVSAAVRMEQIRRDFVANVSHELRTPLTVITGYLETLMDSEEEFAQQYAKPLAQMNQQAHRMESLLKDLLWLSRIESEQRVSKHELVDIHGLLHELREEFGSAFPGNSLTLDLATDQKIHGDYQELYSAFSNLASNAIKYGGGTEEGGGKSAVHIRWLAEPNACVLQVNDSGPGIDAVHIPRLTERFYRIDTSRNSATGGTGLGLAIVKHVAQAHDAELRIESELGKGSTFSMVFPV